MIILKFDVRKSIITLLTLNLVFISLGTNANAQSEQELLLKRRVDLFYKHLTDGKIEKMWELVSKKNRKEKEADKDKDKYKRFLQQFSQTESKVCIKNIKIENTRAVVTVEISNWIEERQEWLGDINNNVWIFEDNNWFFESQIEK